jgi:hypothetical protein
VSEFISYLFIYIFNSFIFSEVLEERENLFPNSAYAKEMVQKHKQNGHAANGH